MLNREKAILNHENFDNNDIKIEELPFINKINLRIDNKNNNQITACGKILGTILPFKPNTYIKNQMAKSIWLGPNEWLIIHDKKELYEKLKNEIGDTEASVTDVSENRTVIQLSGKKAFTLLSKFLVLDLEKNLSNQISCAQTLFVKVPILIIRKHEDKKIPEIDIFANRSHSTYIYSLLVDGTKNLDF